MTESAWGWGVWWKAVWEKDYKGGQGNLGGWRIYSLYDYRDNSMGAYICQNLYVSFKYMWLTHIVCQLYFNRVVKKTQES